MIHKIHNLLNTAIHHFRQDVYWRVHPKRYLPGVDDIPIDRPVFLLGLQGGGLTVTSRIIRRHPDMVCTAGNHTFWTAGDEMQLIRRKELPQELRVNNEMATHTKYPGDHNRIYALDALLPLYRKTAADSTPEIAARFRRVIRETLAVYALDCQRARFIDKSQSYTIQVAFVNYLLESYEPHFLLVIRNPYASCYQAATQYGGVSRLAIPFQDKLRLTSQHWANSFGCALEDSRKVDHFMVVRFEDILRQPEKRLKEICDFIEVDFRLTMLPGPNDRFPLGSRAVQKWYPLRSDVNQKYLQKIRPEYVEIIGERCGELAEQFGYDWR